MDARRHLLAVALACVALAGLMLAGEAWLAVKARVADRLIERAMAAHLRDGEPHAPWSWADTHPIARLELPRLGVRRTVLAGASGSSLAFGPGHVDGTATPNGVGNSVIAGHRDSWFAFLEHVRVGDLLVLETHGGRRTYRVNDLAVRSMWDVVVAAPTVDDRLTLVTCYPFGGLRRSAKRYVVTCQPLGSGQLPGQLAQVLAQERVDPR